MKHIRKTTKYYHADSLDETPILDYSYVNILDMKGNTILDERGTSFERDEYGGIIRAWEEGKINWEYAEVDFNEFINGICPLEELREVIISKLEDQNRCHVYRVDHPNITFHRDRFNYDIIDRYRNDDVDSRMEMNIYKGLPDPDSYEITIRHHKTHYLQGGFTSETSNTNKIKITNEGGIVHVSPEEPTVSNIWMNDDHGRLRYSYYNVNSKAASTTNDPFCYTEEVNISEMLDENHIGYTIRCTDQMAKTVIVHTERRTYNDEGKAIYAVRDGGKTMLCVGKDGTKHPIVIMKVDYEEIDEEGDIKSCCQEES